MDIKKTTQPQPKGTDRLPRSDENTIEQARRWAEENADAIRCYNEYVEKNGLPLEEYRMF